MHPERSILLTCNPCRVIHSMRMDQPTFHCSYNWMSFQITRPRHKTCSKTGIIKTGLTQRLQPYSMLSGVTSCKIHSMMICQKKTTSLMVVHVGMKSCANWTRAAHGGMTKAQQM